MEIEMGIKGCLWVECTERLKERGQENKGDEASIDRPHDEDADEDDGHVLR